MSTFEVSGSMKFMGVVTIILGILALATPLLIGTSVLLLIGIMVAVAGVLRMLWAFRAGSLGQGIMVFLIGILTLLAGIAVLSNPLMASGILTIVLAVYLFVDGFTEIITYFALPSRSGKGWLLLSGLVSIVLGGLIYAQFPVSGVLAIGIFLGIKLLFVGITMLTLGSAAASVAQD
jgi:uncharacterized membrane protein HdeD (DUF308 family)